MKKIREFAKEHKKLVVGVVVLIFAIFAVNINAMRTRSEGTTKAAKSISAQINKSFDFTALDNQGKPTKNKITFTIASTEKTNQVMVNNKTYTATNQKLFLILNLEYKNDTTSSLNVFPGDLIRLTYNNDDGNKFAPDLHNNLVPIAAISTKLDRVGFVVPDNVRNFKLFVGELDGKKETIPVNFPS